MKPPEFYTDREQTYLKHFFLERYLERVAYNILSFADDFVYVDGFSGPWRSKDEAFADTSFAIALDRLRRVRDAVSKNRSEPRVRCVFVEKVPGRYRELEQATSDIEDINILTLNAEFEEAIPEVRQFIGNAFSLVFIDPTGWKGFALERIAPLLRGPGEVIVNFMFDHINRFLDKENPQAFDALFGGPGWESAVAPGTGREDSIVGLYCERMKQMMSFRYVTSTRILKSTSERSYFHLIYGTRHPKGLLEFRGVEKNMIQAQERVRFDANQAARIERTGQTELFGSDDVPSLELGSFERRRLKNVETARDRLTSLVDTEHRVSFDDARGAMLEVPMVWESDVKESVLRLWTDGKIEIKGMRPTERTPKSGHILVKRPGQP